MATNFYNLIQPYMQTSDDDKGIRSHLNDTEMQKRNPHQSLRLDKISFKSSDDKLKSRTHPQGLNDILVSQCIMYCF